MNHKLFLYNVFNPDDSNWESRHPRGSVEVLQDHLLSQFMSKYTTLFNFCYLYNIPHNIPHVIFQYFTSTIIYLFTSHIFNIVNYIKHLTKKQKVTNIFSGHLVISR